MMNVQNYRIIAALAALSVLTIGLPAQTMASSPSPTRLDQIADAVDGYIASFTSWRARQKQEMAGLNPVQKASISLVRAAQSTRPHDPLALPSGGQQGSGESWLEGFGSRSTARLERNVSIDLLVSELAEKIASHGNGEPWGKRQVRGLLFLSKDVETLPELHFNTIVSYLLARYYHEPRSREAVYHLISTLSDEVAEEILDQKEHRKALNHAVEAGVTTLGLISVALWKSNNRFVLKDILRLGPRVIMDRYKARATGRGVMKTSDIFRTRVSHAEESAIEAFMKRNTRMVVFGTSATVGAAVGLKHLYDGTVPIKIDPMSVLPSYQALAVADLEARIIDFTRGVDQHFGEILEMASTDASGEAEALNELIDGYRIHSLNYRYYEAQFRELAAELQHFYENPMARQFRMRQRLQRFMNPTGFEGDAGFNSIRQDLNAYAHLYTRSHGLEAQGNARAISFAEYIGLPADSRSSEAYELPESFNDPDYTRTRVRGVRPEIQISISAALDNLMSKSQALSELGVVMESLGNRR